jgi:hypothetical protein
MRYQAQFGEYNIGSNESINYRNMTSFFEYILEEIYTIATGGKLQSDISSTVISKTNVSQIANQDIKLIVYFYSLLEELDFRKEQTQLIELYVDIYDKFYKEESFQFQDEYGVERNLRVYLTNQLKFL